MFIRKTNEEGSYVGEIPDASSYKKRKITKCMGTFCKMNNTCTDKEYETLEVGKSGDEDAVASDSIC